MERWPRAQPDHSTAERRGEPMKSVVAYDGSDPAKRALDPGAGLAGEHGKLLVIATAEPVEGQADRGAFIAGAI
jgi:hypothetical protein